MVPLRHHLNLPRVVRKRQEWGMTLTPPLSRRKLLAAALEGCSTEESNGEPNAVGQSADNRK